MKSHSRRESFYFMLLLTFHVPRTLVEIALSPGEGIVVPSKVHGDDDDPVYTS